MTGTTTDWRLGEGTWAGGYRDGTRGRERKEGHIYGTHMVRGEGMDMRHGYCGTGRVSREVAWLYGILWNPVSYGEGHRYGDMNPMESCQLWRRS